MTTVLAVDPGACTGWALADDGAVLASGIVREPGPSKARPTLAHRQAEYAARVRGIADRLDSVTIDAIVVEWPTGSRFVQPLQRLAWRAGVWAGAVCVEQSIEITPSEWAAAAGLPTGDGFEAGYIARARTLLDREPVTPDEAAAVCLAARASLRLSQGLPVGRTEEEAAEALREQGKAGRARKKVRRTAP